MLPLKSALPSTQHSFFPSLTHLTLTPPSPSSLPHLTLPSSSSFALAPSLSLLHPSLSAFCSNSGVTSCRKSHGSSLGEKWLKAEPRWQPNCHSFFYDYHYTTTRLTVRHLATLKVCASLSFPAQVFPTPCPVLSPHQQDPQILFAKSKWLCVQRQRERRNAWETEMLEIREMGGGGVYRAVMSSSDVTSAVSRQDAAMCHTDKGRRE